MSVWHSGELAFQRAHGVADRMADVGPRVIRSFMPEQHRAFFEQLPYLFLGAVDDQGRPWASLRLGPPGSIASPDPQTLEVGMRRTSGDPINRSLRNGASIGVLGLELPTRRRNRANGFAGDVDAHGRFRLAVRESFGNCPRYIHPRTLAPAASGEPTEVHRSDSLDERARQIIRRADTFFVATFADVDGQRRVDVSHRGGEPGFVELDADGRLVIPDYAGNMFFNTLGNIVASGKAGLLFPDFGTGNLLQLSGDAEVLDVDQPGHRTGVVYRWRVAPASVVLRCWPHPSA